MEDNKTAKRIGSAIRIILGIALFVFIGALVFRMCQASYKGLEETVVTPSLKSAYAISDDIRTHAVNDEFSENGAVYAYSLVYIEQGGYLQLSVRYNQRHIDEVKLSYPQFDEKNIKYQLVDANGTVYTPLVIDKLEKYNYTYFKLEFEGVDFSTNTLSVRMVLDGIDINTLFEKFLTEKFLLS